MPRDKIDTEVEQLMSEIDHLGRDIEQRGKAAARHLRSAAAKRDTRTSRPISGRYVVRLVKRRGSGSDSDIAPRSF